MYPREELRELARRKAQLQQRIAARREQCAAAAICVTRPLVWLDQALEMWRRIPPFARLAALPLGRFLLRSFPRRPDRLRRLLRWGSLLAGVLSGWRRARNHRAT